jgi:hypothetical protein
LAALFSRSPTQNFPLRKFFLHLILFREESLSPSSGPARSLPSITSIAVELFCLSDIHWNWEAERQRERQRETERETESERERERKRETETETERET